MSSTLQFELTSPDKVALAKPVAMVNVPGPTGMVGILPGHAPMVTTIAPGVVEVYANDEHTITERVFVTGGYCDVTTDSCSLLADQILSLSEIDKKAAQAEVNDLIKQRGELGPDDNGEKIEEKLAIAMAKMNIGA